ncbi:hypothetical protein AB4Z50_04785 [Paenibacillus sp. 2TAB26]|uniref:hypothetical protein n=1 Tax=Paenibacillus sp. 2TAB26 TaxID=3233005 RepID=UPI003F9B5CAD
MSIFVIRNYACKIFGAIGVLLLLYILGIVVITGYNEALNFNGFYANGSFQLYNPLRRMSIGETPGVDFQFFHGIGVLFFHYPIYKLFGENLFASVFAMFVVSPILFLLSLGFVLKMICRRWDITLGVLAISVIFSHYYLLPLIYHGNSLLGVRSSVPLWILGFLLWNQKTEVMWLKKKYVFEGIVGILLAVAFFCGSEHGLASVVGYGVSYLLGFKKETLFSQLKSLTLTALFFLISLFMLYFIVAKQYFWKPIKYALIDLPSDQFWYFGAPPNDFIDSFKDFFLYPTIYVPIIVSLILLLIIRRKSLPISFALIYGLVSTFSIMGIFAEHYLTPLIRIEFIVIVWIISQYRMVFKEIGQIVFILVMIVCLCLFSFSDKMPTMSNSLKALALSNQPSGIESAEGVFYSQDWFELINTFNKYKSFIQTEPLSDANWENGINRNKPLFFLPYSDILLNRIQNMKTITFAFSGERNIVNVSREGNWMHILVDGEALNPTLDGHPNKIRIGSGGDKIWSTYASVLEYETDQFHPETDYIIHALGKKGRQHYVDTFIETNPDFVRTLNKSFIYEEWLQNSHWDFYEELLLRYEAIEQVNTGMFWMKKEKSSVRTSFQEGILENEEATLPIPYSAEKRLFTVEIDYTVKNPYNFIPIFSKLPRYLVYRENSMNNFGVSLPPYETQFKFPLLVDGNTTPKLSFKTSSLLPGGRLVVSKVKFREILLSDKTKQIFIPNK